MNYGYNNVARIPKGAVNILIRQLNGTIDDNNSLALRSFNGSYLVNGNLVISNYERTVWYEGAKIEYSGTGVLNETEMENDSKIDNEESTNIDDEIERISLTEKRLRNEYNAELNKIKHKRIEYSIDYIHRLYDKQREIKEQRRQLQDLMQQKYSSSFKSSRVRNKVSKVNRIKYRKPFNETIIIKQKLKKDIYLEVLSVGELLRPDIEYQYYLKVDAESNNKQSDLDLVKNDYNYNLKYSKLKDNLLNYRQGKQDKQLNINKLNYENNDKLILNQLSDNEIKMKTKSSSKNSWFQRMHKEPNQSMIKTKDNYIRNLDYPKNSDIKNPTDLKQIKNFNRRHNRRVDKDLHAKKGTRQSKAKCSSTDKLRSKNCNQIALSSRTSSASAKVNKIKENKRSYASTNLGDLKRPTNSHK